MLIHGSGGTSWLLHNRVAPKEPLCYDIQRHVICNPDQKSNFDTNAAVSLANPIMMLCSYRQSSNVIILQPFSVAAGQKE